MAPVRCPDCGAQVSDTAIVCAQCGFPLRRDVLGASTGRGGGSSSRNTAGIIMAVVVAGVFGIVVIGILAALAIPRFTATRRVRELEGEHLLNRVFTLENTYYANNGAYAPTLDGLRSVGWEQAHTPLFYTVDIRLGPEPREFCLEARPGPGMDTTPLSMDEVGVLYHRAGCTTEPVSQARAPASRPQAPDEVPGEGGDAGARTPLREVYQSVAEYRPEHAADPPGLGPAKPGTKMPS
jgi:Tfp pilus assembly protein PilE